tara:strand:+ start:2075 stop:4732 length:2658 start_codon:yes stop_codon:yes gene_type:complete
MLSKISSNLKNDTDIVCLSEALNKKNSINDIKRSLADLNKKLKERFLNKEPIDILVHLHSIAIDQIIICVWRKHKLDDFKKITLIAVGGYGRQELLPQSDIDIMILLGDRIQKETNELISNFLTNLWDIGFDLGHSVRTLKECKMESKKDVITITTLMESRKLIGDDLLYESMKDSIASDKMWPSERYFKAKRIEQEKRHLRSDNTAYKLEPNVKISPGGLRDIQLIGWIAKRHFSVSILKELIDHNFLTIGQLKRLHEGQNFLWRIRYGLHIITKRREDRLLFDHQKNLAEILGYEDAAYTLAVEQFMQRYYRTVMDLNRINEMLIQLFEEAILLNPNNPPIKINDRFQIRNGYIETSNNEIFNEAPSALLEIFHHMQQNHKIKGVSAYTIGLIKRDLHLIDEEFRQNPKNHRLFLSIINAPSGVTHELRRMNLYGVLGLYIPAFGRIVGRMQYDLFHAYTVDEHTLFVVSNLRRFALSRFDHEYPDCSQIMQSLKKSETLYLAGLFHDIAKGRGGDHSELGAIEAEAFCLEHGMSKRTSKTVAWLVKNHLLFSVTAQKKDISDPFVINEFTKFVGDKLHLDYLYLLTIADIRATNPNLWNSWKATLFLDLYNSTNLALRSGVENPINRNQLITDKSNEAAKILSSLSIKKQKIQAIWNLHTKDYFLRYRASEIAWHTETLIRRHELKEGFIEIKEQKDLESIQILLYTPQSMRTFAFTTAILDELGMNIVDARIVPMKNDYSIDNYVFINADKKQNIDKKTINKIKTKISDQLVTNVNHKITVSRRESRRKQIFLSEPEIVFKQDNSNKRTILELIINDRPGILSTIGLIFTELDISIETAKIATIGEKAEDVFFITNQNRTALSDSLIKELELEMSKKLHTL